MSEQIVRPKQSSDSRLARKTAKVFEPIGKRVFHAIAKTSASGLPAAGSLDEWLSSSAIDRELTGPEATAAARISLEIEREAFACLARFLADAEIRESIHKGLLNSHLRRQRELRSQKRSTPIEAVVRSNLEASAVNIIAVLLQQNVLTEVGDTQESLKYLYVDRDSPKETWRKITPASLSEKISRLKKKVRDADRDDART